MSTATVVRPEENQADWILLEEGALKGVNIVVDRTSSEVVSLSTRGRRDADRWKEAMPSLEGFPALRTLDLDGCRYLRELHGSVGSLRQLRRLFVTRCDRLERLPSSLCSLMNLQEVRQLPAIRCAVCFLVFELLGLFSLTNTKHKLRFSFVLILVVGNTEHSWS